MEVTGSAHGETDVGNDISRRLDEQRAMLVAVEGVYATIAAVILRNVDPGLMEHVLRELRSGIAISVQGLPAGPETQLMNLRVEEHAQNLLDQIERLARKVG
jgi:hypothetical protein